jgi:hypothetical protein
LHLSELVSKYGKQIKVVGVNVDGEILRSHRLLRNSLTARADVDGEQPKVNLQTWLAARKEINYVIGADNGSRKVIKEFLDRGQYLGLPAGKSGLLCMYRNAAQRLLAFVITAFDSTIRFVGDPNSLDATIQGLL